jgi:anti-sigma B factor antagonist
MNPAAAKLLVLIGEHFACVKIVGRANFSSSIDFKTLLNELVQKGYRYFVLDMSECQLMDSTFLGVLAGFGLKMGQNGSGTAPMELLNANSRISELLDNLGVIHLFRMTQGPLQVPKDATAVLPQPSCPTQEDLQRACLEAHRLLMELNPENVARFKDVAQFLAEDLKKLKPVP